ncbi:hypothetical protein EDD85DRAFT_798365 [Armillaria nabsnona]|nr:hypothetical protein EDD85DRAFT_798365 [Armillaria nabsnona]
MAERRWGDVGWEGIGHGQVDVERDIAAITKLLVLEAKTRPAPYHFRQNISPPSRPSSLFINGLAQLVVGDRTGGIFVSKTPRGASSPHALPFTISRDLAAEVGIDGKTGRPKTVASASYEGIGLTIVPQLWVKGNDAVVWPSVPASRQRWRESPRISDTSFNPWDKTGTANGIYEALNDTWELDGAEGRCRRWEELLGWIEEQSAQKFITRFLGCCSRAWQEHQRGTDGNSRSVEVLDKSKIGRVLVQWRQCKRKLVLVDLEGTLWDREKFRSKMKFEKGVDALDPGLRAAIELLVARQGQCFFEDVREAGVTERGL